MSARAPIDNFAEHYAQTFWNLIPELYRHEDLFADPPGQLWAICEILGDEAAVARRSIDRTLADTRIDEADDWALPYIARLLGTRLTNALNPAARRADIGHTIAYRRRAGTPRLLERLADDIADWDAVASESFLRLARRWHMLDTDVITGPVTRSLRYGYPRLTSTRVSDVIDGPFDDMAHHVQIRPPDALRGRLYEIAGVSLFVFRQYSFPLGNSTPFQLDDTHYTLDPSGRDVPLFQRGGLEDGNDCTEKQEWSVRAPITCRRLNAAHFRLDDDPTHPPSWAPLINRTYLTAQDLIADATALGAAQIPKLLDAALVENCPKAQLIVRPDTPAPSIDLAIRVGASGNSLDPHALLGADLAGWADGLPLDPWVEALIDPKTGRVQLAAPPPGSRRLLARLSHYGAFWPVGAGTHDRRRTVPSGGPAPVGLAPAMSLLTGNYLFGDSRTYLPTKAAGVIQITGDTRMWAADRARPYLRVAASTGQRRIRLIATGGRHSLELNGLWLAIALQGAPAPDDRAELVLEGDWNEVVMRDVTLDPGGDQAVLPGSTPVRIPHVRLVVAGTIAHLRIERCVLGSLTEGLGRVGGACSAARVSIEDSVIVAHTAEPAIALGTASLSLRRSTVLGHIACALADISETIVDGDVIVENAQNSCFRFSAARSGGRIPAQYESILFPAGLPHDLFVSRRFGDPGFVQLADTCPSSVARGGEDGTEMGAFNRAIAPIKHDDLTAKLAEYAPIQARVQIVTVT